MQGCNIHCEGCHNKHTWDFEGGHEFTPQVLDNIVNGLTAQGVTRNLCILGGEPLDPQNQLLTALVVSTVREKVPAANIWVWTGFSMEHLLKNRSSHMSTILKQIDGLVTEPFILAQRDITLPMRGSRNQKIMIFDRKNNLWYNLYNKDERYELNG